MLITLGKQKLLWSPRYLANRTSIFEILKNLFFTMDMGCRREIYKFKPRFLLQ